MRLRVVEMMDGRFKCQVRTGLFFWAESVKDPSSDREDQIRHAKSCMPPPKIAIKRVVWP